MPQGELHRKLENICKYSTKDEVTEQYQFEDQSSCNQQTLLMKKIQSKVPFEISDTLAKEIPDSWEFYGDLLLIGGGCFTDSCWTEHMEAILDVICDVFHVKRVARKRAVTDDEFRSPKTDMLRGSDTWVSRKENGIVYHFDVTKSMFCSGNITEKLRIAKFDCSGETVVDLFAGIGYFTLPYLVHARAERVVACEWNPASVAALRHNLAAAGPGVAARCAVLLGDNRAVCPRNIADRVNLGLIPTSAASWRTACLALKDGGGVLHLHGNVECAKQADRRQEFESWAAAACRSISQILAEVKNTSFCVTVSHVECVKSYAPRIYHIVVDLKCDPCRETHLPNV